MTKATPTNNVIGAKNFLDSYQNYTKNPFFGELSSTLDNVDVGKNVTKISGNTQLEVSAIDGYTTFKWTYAFNGIIAPSKFVALGFNNSFLTAFVDNWQFYSIGSTSVNLSESEAKATALDTAKTHDWSLQLDVETFETKNFNESDVVWTALIFDGSLGARKIRSEDPLTLYPVWRAGVQLDKWYGQMYGIEIDIWADSKEIRSAQEAWSTLPPPEGTAIADLAMPDKTSNEASLLADQNLAISIALLAFAAVIAGTILCARKKITVSYGSPGIHVPKIAGVSFFILMLSFALLAHIATVNGTTRSGIVGGSQSDGADDGNGDSWRKSTSEVNLQNYVAPNIAGNFSQAGYSGYDCQGDQGSLKDNFLSGLSTNQSSRDYVAVVYFDHGVGRSDYLPENWGYPYNEEFHYMIEDNDGTLWDDWQDVHVECGIYDTDIYPLIQAYGKINFAFINTCLSANLSAQPPDYNPSIGQGYLEPDWPPVPARYEGMPYAWMHRIVEAKSTQGFNINDQMSIDGYNDPDDGSQCYIGFPWGSASLEQDIPYQDGTPYYQWVERFFKSALSYDISVNMALDYASWETLGYRFGESFLRTGYDAYWWMKDQDPTIWHGSTMAVYGNGNIHLRNYLAGWYDNFNDNSRDTSKWDTLQANGGTANEANQQLEVTVQSGSGQAQAGFVTTNAHSVQNQKVTITVTQLSNVDEMTLQIGTTKVTASDPYSQNNWYRILKSRSSSYVYIQRNASGTLSTMVAAPWISATGELTIQVYDGRVYFYENEVLKYSESYALPSYNCYVYAFTSTPRQGASLTDKFDNFALSQSPGWNDNFNDNSLATSAWAKLEVNAATANETSSQLHVTVPSGSGWAQAGYVTQNTYNMQNKQAAVEVAELDQVYEMSLMISTTKTTNSDPASESNWYRITKMKQGYSSNIVTVESKVSGSYTLETYTTWDSSTGQLTISVMDGAIGFFENGKLRHSESFALPSSNCYIYTYTSSPRTASGTEKFDNFALTG